MPEAGGGAAPAPFRVLVVDDDPDMAGFLTMWLKREGMDTLVAQDGESALMKIMTEAPDLVLCDVMMPGPDGFEICRRVKADESTALLPVVLVTALEDQESRVRGIEAGADDDGAGDAHRHLRIKLLYAVGEDIARLDSFARAARGGGGHGRGDGRYAGIGHGVFASRL